MSQEKIKLPLPKRLYVIGANGTPPPDVLPWYADPICEDGEDPSSDLLYIMNPEPADGLNIGCSTLMRDCFEEACQEGHSFKLATPERFAWHKRLVFVRPNDAPWYLRKKTMEAVLNERGHAALGEAALFYEQDKTFVRAEASLWYAIRACGFSLAENPVTQSVAVTRLIQAYLKTLSQAARCFYQQEGQ